MSLIDIESTKSELICKEFVATAAVVAASTPSTTTTSTLTPTSVPTQKIFEYPLRETSSFPHMSNMEKENESNHMLNEDIIYKINAVQFNAGCSSSSTDLDKLIEFYNEHSDEETLAQWMTIYEEQKLANSIAAASNKGSSNLSRYKNRKFHFDFDLSCESAITVLKGFMVTVSAILLSRVTVFDRIILLQKPQFYVNFYNYR